jgi:hypothetical protein
MPRKTFDVAEFTAKMNNRISRETSEDARRAFCYVLADVLHETGQYRGFQYLDWENGGYDRWVNDGRPTDNRPYLGPEHKRRYY